MITLPDVFADRVSSYRGRVAVVEGDRRLTYEDFGARVQSLAGVLVDSEVKVGDRIIWLGQNSFRVIELLLASARVGAVFCPLNWRMSDEELAFCMGDLDPALVVCETESAPRLRNLVAEDRIIVVEDDSSGIVVEDDSSGIVVEDDDSSGYERRLAETSANHAWPELTGIEPVLGIYAASPDGHPNAVLLSHVACIAQSLVISNIHEITDQAVCLNSAPMFHIAAFMFANATLLAGGTNVVVPRAEAEAMCLAIESERCTHAIIFPVTLAAIKELNATRYFDLGSLWSAPDLSDKPTTMLTPSSAPWARGPGGYGQTEVCGLATFNALAPDSLGASGRSSPAVAIRIVDERDDEVPAGETGEIAIGGLTVMNGYHNRPELNAARRRGPWHLTGDLGRRLEDGSVEFVGPKVKMIKSGAENVFPAEVEACLARHPVVGSVCVIGVPDDRFTQTVRAIVVTRGETSEDELIAFCRLNLATHKRPRSVVFADELPRGPTGAIDREAADVEFGGGGYPGSAGR